MSTSLLRVVERARREPEGRFYSLAHRIDVPALERAFHRLRGNAAVGVDGVSKAEYGQGLEANLEDLHRRLKKKRYRLATDAARTLADVVQDAEQGPEAIQSNGLRMVSAPPTPTGRGPARSAQETLGRTLQLLRSERQPSKSGPSGSRHATGLAQMAAPSQPAHASHVGAVQPIVGTLPDSPAAGCRADMGGVATRHISGGAGWWKSPCPDLVRASGEQSPGATRPPNQAFGNSSSNSSILLPSGSDT